MNTPTQFNTTWILGKQNSPTFDFYFRSRKATTQGYREVDVLELNDASHPFWRSQHDRVILVRDIPVALLKRLLEAKDTRTFIWFIDDDIPAVSIDNTLPVKYRKRLSSWFIHANKTLAKLCSDIWVSTPYLAQKYNLPSTSILPPLQPCKKETLEVRCFYHGSSSHTQEWQFVIQLVEQIQRQHKHTSFELIGDHQLYKQVRHIPRVTVLHPMSWENYQSHIASRDMDIGLAPLLPSEFNNARSHCKLFDIQKQSAIGIYSNRFPQAETIKTNQAGLIADDSVESWLFAFNKALGCNRKLILENSAELITCMQNDVDNGLL